MSHDGSCGCSAAGLRGSPKNVRSHSRVAYHAVTTTVSMPDVQTSQPVQP